MNIKAVWTGLLILVLSGCTKENKTFTLKTIRLNDYRGAGVPAQRLYLKVFGDNNTIPLTQTGYYPAELTLPATFKVSPALPMTPYSKMYYVQLWGDSSGYIGSCKVDMEEYKIIFPIDMEVKSDSLSVSLAGSWK